MNFFKKIFFLCIILCFCTFHVFSQAVKVEVVQNAGQWTLLRGGQPYYIKGAGGQTHLDLLVEIGGNSIRTWHADDAQKVLDEAHAKGLTVMFGLWLQVERHGFDYNNEELVAQQLAEFREIVLKFKDHPALLMWGVGNEVDLFYTNFKVWDAVQDIAEMIHELDENHPTTTAIAGLNEREVKLIMEHAPDIDILSVNAYGSMCGIKDNILNYGWQKPYIVTEWGPNGHWEVHKTAWQAPVEQTSHEKALTYYNSYKNCIASQTKNCLGSYVFFWGQKQETTATWYGLFTKNGQPTETIDYIQHSWTGEWAQNRAPALDSIFVNSQKIGENIYLTSNETYKAKVFVTDDQNEPLEYFWQIIPESTDVKSGGDFEQAPLPLEGLIETNNVSEITFTAPSQKGAYRIFVYVADNQQKLAYANVPFFEN